MNATSESRDEFSAQDAVRAAENLTALWRSGGTLGDVLDITADECEALYAFGHTQYQQGKYSDAFKAFAQATIYNHMEPRYQSAAGAAAQMLGRYEDALRRHLAVTVMKLDDPAPVYHCAECLLALGKLPEAAETLELVADMCKDPEHAGLKSRAQALLGALKTKMAAK